jgi:hypothetical protein
MRKIIASTAVAAGALGLMAVPASADNHRPTQEGLVNVFVADTTVQVPVGVAANVCDVTVAALTQATLDDAAECDAEASPRADGDGGTAYRDPDQRGLVNLTLTDTTIQIPVGVALNVCDVTVAALTGPVLDRARECDAIANPVADA